MARISVSVEDMDIAATRCTQLSQKLEECRIEIKSINDQLQGAWEGQSAVAFEEYVTGTAAPVLEECSRMCEETSAALKHTCAQFTEADGTLSGTFAM